MKEMASEPPLRAWGEQRNILQVNIVLVWVWDEGALQVMESSSPSNSKTTMFPVPMNE